MMSTEIEVKEGTAIELVTIPELPEVTELADDDNIVIGEGVDAKRISGANLKAPLIALASQNIIGTITSASQAAPTTRPDGTALQGGEGMRLGVDIITAAQSADVTLTGFGNAVVPEGTQGGTMSYDKGSNTWSLAPGALSTEGLQKEATLLTDGVAAGLASQEETQPTIDYATLLQGFISVLKNGGGLAIADANGNIAFKIDEDATGWVTNFIASVSMAAPQYKMSSLTLSPLKNYLFAIADMNGNMILKVDMQGNIINLNSFNTALRNFYGLRRKTAHYLWYGQSNTVGGDVNAFATTVTIPFAYTFKEGAVTATLNGGNPSKLSAFVPFAPTTAIREIPSFGLADMLSQAIAKTGGSQFLNDEVLLHSTAGVGAESINSLIKGTAVYNDLIKSVQSAYNIAQGDYYVPGIFWAQGEADYGTINRADYATILRQLISDLRTDIKAITGQTEEIHFYLYQNDGLQTSNMTFSGDIPLALVDVMADVNVHPICPFHIFDYKNTQSSHLVTNHYKYFGAYAGLAVKKVMIDNMDVKPIVPKQYVQVDATTLDIIYDNVNGHLVIDSTWVTDPGGYGYNFSGGVTVSSVEVVSADRIRIKTSAAYAGKTLNYGLQGLIYNGRTAGNRGCLRDSSGYQNNYIPSDGAISEFPLHNWAMMHTTNL